MRLLKVLSKKTHWRKERIAFQKKDSKQIQIIIIIIKTNTEFNIFRHNVADLRDTDLEDVVLDQLFTQHDDAELNAKLDEATSWCTLGETHTSISQQQQMFHLITQERRSADPQAGDKPLPSDNH